MWTIITKASAFVFIIALSYLLKRKGFFKASDFGLISDIVLKITLPCAVISNFSKIEVDTSLFGLIALGLACNLLTVGLGYAAGAGKSPGYKAFNMINFSGYNIGCFTLPYVQSFLGAPGVIAACLFDAGNSVMCTGATYSMAAAVAGTGEKSTARVFFKRMFSSVPMDTYIVMVILSIAGIRLPHIITAFSDVAGSANSFLAMMMIGIGFELHLTRASIMRVTGILLWRYTVAAILSFLFFYFAPFPYEIRKILALIPFAPVSAVCTIFTSRCGGDVAMSCTINSLTIVIGIVVMTTIMILL